MKEPKIFYATLKLLIRCKKRSIIALGFQNENGAPQDSGTPTGIINYVRELYHTLDEPTVIDLP